jgi:hypothetical protein
MTQQYRSFAEQSAHYFNRPHSAVPSEPVICAAAWQGPELAAVPHIWQHTLSQSEIDEIQQAIKTVHAAELSLEQITSEHFRLPKLQSRIAQWKNNIMQGVGLQLVKGLPVSDWSSAETAIAYWGIGHHLGVPGAQNPDNELLGHVKDYGETTDNPFVRLYRTTSNIRFHCDAADIVGLLCLQPAKQGGQSRIVSTVTLFNELLKQHPNLAPRLFQPFKLDRRGEMKEGQKPYSLLTPSRFDSNSLRTFYHSDYFHSVERHPGISLTEEETKILDFYDTLGLDDRFYLDMDLEPGDMQFISNHTIAHARTEYEDFEDSNKKRHLLRLWLSAQ